MEPRDLALGPSSLGSWGGEPGLARGLEDRGSRCGEPVQEVGRARRALRLGCPVACPYWAVRACPSPELLLLLLPFPPAPSFPDIFQSLSALSSALDLVPQPAPHLWSLASIPPSAVLRFLLPLPYPRPASRLPPINLDRQQGSSLCLHHPAPENKGGPPDASATQTTNTPRALQPPAALPPCGQCQSKGNRGARSRPAAAHHRSAPAREQINRRTASGLPPAGDHPPLV